MSLNLYMYCYNNPIYFIDPSGHTSIDDLANDFDDMADSWASDPDNQIMDRSDIGFYDSPEEFINNSEAAGDDFEAMTGYDVDSDYNSYSTSGGISEISQNFNFYDAHFSTGSGLQTFLEAANIATTAIAGVTSLCGWVTACTVVGVPEGGVMLAISEGATGVNIVVVNTQESHGYISPAEADQARIEDYIALTTGGVSTVAKGGAKAAAGIIGGAVGAFSFLRSWI